MTARNQLLFSLAAFSAAFFWSGAAQAQSVFGRNLVINGDAEAGPASGSASTPVTAIPGWNRIGNTDVVAYGSGGLKVDSPGPATRGAHYFVGGPSSSSSSISQDIDVSSAANSIDSGTITFDASAYLGGIADQGDNAKVVVSFLGSGGNTLTSATVGPVNKGELPHDGSLFRRAIGIVPPTTRKIDVSLQFNRTDGSYDDGTADNISLTLNTPAAANTVLGSNLLVNGGAEAGPAADSDHDLPNDIPAWSRSGEFSVEAYKDDSNYVRPSDPGPSGRGKNYFTGGPSGATATATQDVDLSPAAATVDTGAVTFTLSGWLGGHDNQNDNAVFTATFLDFGGKILGSATLGPVTASDRQNNTGLLARTQNGTLPGGARIVHFVLTMTRTDGSYNDGYADQLSFVLVAPGSVPQVNKVIAAGDYGAFTTISPGSFIEIYGTNLATTSRTWSGADFNALTAPTSLDGVSVTVGGQKAFVSYISSTQVNAYVPSNIGTGPLTVMVTNSSGSSLSYTVTSTSLQPALLAPTSFTSNGKQYVVAFFPDNTYAAPTGVFPGVNSRPARPGETITLYGLGFGPVTPAVPSGTLAQGLTTLVTPVQISFNGTPAAIAYQGQAPNYVGLYQFNVVVPNIADDPAAKLTFNVGGIPGAQTLYIPVHQ